MTLRDYLSHSGETWEHFAVRAQIPYNTLVSYMRKDQYRVTPSAKRIMAIQVATRGQVRLDDWVNTLVKIPVATSNGSGQ